MALLQEVSELRNVAEIIFQPVRRQGALSNDPNQRSLALFERFGRVDGFACVGGLVNLAGRRDRIAYRHGRCVEGHQVKLHAPVVLVALGGIGGQGTVFAGSQSGAADLRLGDILRDREVLEAARSVATRAVDLDRDSEFVRDVMAEVEVFIGRDTEWLSRS